MKKEDVIKILASVQDPTTGQPLSSANSLSSVEVQDEVINISLSVDKITPEVKNKLNFACLSALYPHYPKASVNVHFETPTNTQANNPLAHIKNIIAVASGKGGVGKSTISANLAVGLSQAGYKVGLLDADLYGPSMPTMFGMTQARPKMTKVHDQPKLVPIEKEGIHLMSIGFVIEPEQAVVLRGPRLAGIVRQFLTECLWPQLDFLIVDLPPGTGDIQLTLVQAVPVTAAVLVTTPQQVAVADAIKAANMLLMPNIDVPILGVVENMSWFTPNELPDKKYQLFGKGGGKKLAGLFDSQLLAQIPLVESVGEEADKGGIAIADNDSLAKPFLDEMVDKVLYFLEIRNRTQPASKRVEIKN